MPKQPEKKHGATPRDEPRPDTEPNVIGKKGGPGNPAEHMREQASGGREPAKGMHEPAKGAGEQAKKMGKKPGWSPESDE